MQSGFRSGHCWLDGIPTGAARPQSGRDVIRFDADVVFHRRLDARVALQQFQFRRHDSPSPACSERSPEIMTAGELSGSQFEWTSHEHFCDLESARCSVFEYIETFYNLQQIHQALGYLTPDQFEADLAPATAACRTQQLTITIRSHQPPPRQRLT